MARRFAKTTNIIRSYGWKPSFSKEPKNFYEPPHMARLPTSVDLESQCPAIYNQESLGACTSHAAAALAQFLMKKIGSNWIPSRLALYYWNRLQEGTVNEDSGASLQDAMSSMVKYGVPHESLWTYNISKFNIKPPKEVWSDAYWHTIRQGLSVRQDLNTMKTRLAEGLPVIFGFMVYESFESQEVTRTGIMPMPKEGEELKGGHAVMIVGFNDSTKMFKIRNSWGTSWGKNGYFFMPYDFIINPNYASDFWTANAWLRFNK